ncbi:MAG: hypothetical protein Q4C96_07390 [Planctomycetia bacterium]|nr:hypothetical protein [Planctomycetia bacterium]
MSTILVSDAALRAASMLRKSPIEELRQLTIQETADGLCICGNLSRYYYKQLAQETLRRICKDAELVLQNHTQVHS